eukprot:CAMPEP_0115832758 /NCGR_PEP_ID=MMETSP0287-20121206/2823_1 /TAXON_ID=412157 /ORGANISM="Chrysochromulina rotalis, Strain UIO044" /LENGTH=321 /DNA_ID=CAMNT_0003286153 /DNA_START=140 /DNA_END=1105 /DNA_ORIENTATION=+
MAASFHFCWSKIRASAEGEKQQGLIQRCEDEANAHECSFWWVSAEALRHSKDVTLPKFQELRKRDGFLEKKTVSRYDSVHGTLANNFLTVSHRWLGGGGAPPDPTGTQLTAIRNYLADHLEVEWVWFDYWSMPQDIRSAEEKIEFKHMLKHANLLYLGTRVLILLDLSYISRFWTQFEAWLSMQTPSGSGLVPATPETRRYHIVPIHGANRTMADGLVAMWATRTPTDAYTLLSEPDVTVTNQSDKDLQLEKLLSLNEEVQSALQPKPENVTVSVHAPSLSHPMEVPPPRAPFEMQSTALEVSTDCSVSPGATITLPYQHV